MKIIVSSVVLILCLLGMSSAVPINESPASEVTVLSEPATLESGSEENVKRQVRQVAVNAGPVRVGVDPLGGVGVRVGDLFNLGLPPSYPIAYASTVPIVYTAAVPFAYPGSYSYRRNY